MRILIISLFVLLYNTSFTQNCNCDLFEKNFEVKNGKLEFFDAENKLQIRIEPNGKIWAREVEVSVHDFPDFVFTSEYKLLSLSEIKKYIDENGHLPEMPSAQQAEQEGISLGEFNKLLLQKIEELTLHLIRLEEEIESLKNN